jgi:transcriptional regulator with XRE-family HTH domain
MLRIKSDPEVLTALGHAIAAERTRRAWRQNDLAAKAGVSRRALQTLETGAPSRTDTLIRVLRALQLLDRLGAFLAPSLDPVTSPLEETPPEPPQRVRVRRRPTEG